MGNDIHWFPGHMGKALREIEEKIKRVDIVIELLDIRIPKSSINEEFEKLTQNKKHLFVYTKNDLADPIITKDWESYFKNNHIDYIIVNVNKDNVKDLLAKKIKELGKEKQQKEIAKGMKPQPIKAMIIGIPNVGKSSLINKIANRKAAGVENRPGFTRGEQLIKVNNDFLLVDTPGVLPMSYSDKTKAINLALVGSIKEEILPSEELAKYLLSYFKKYYPNALVSRFGINEITDYESTLNLIAEKRGLLIKNGEKDIEKAIILLLNEFKNGTLGRFSLERIKWV